MSRQHFNLFRETGELFTWLASILRSFWQVRPGVTFAVISASAAARVTNLLAFVLPLKVILLAGSDGVPRYFRFFIDPADKMGWIIGLSIAAVVFYAITLILDALSSRLSSVGGGEVTTGANDISIIGAQESEAKSYYATCCQLWANLAFVVLGLTALVFLDRLLFLVLFGLVALQYGFSAWAIRNAATGAPNRLAAFILDNLKNYLKLFSSANFLLGFLVILAPFVIHGDGNILIAILSIIVVRQVLNTLMSFINDGVRMIRDRHLIDPLVFREAQVRDKEARESATFRRLFAKDTREARVASVLAANLPVPAAVTVEWRDSPLRGMYTFLVRLAADSGEPEKRAQLQVLGRRRAHQFEREAFLFRHVARAEFAAPEWIGGFEEEGFACQICEFGQGEAVPAAAWKDVGRDLLCMHWSRRPPEALVDGYAASHPLMHQRLSDDLVQRLIIAADSKLDRGVLKNFRARLAAIAARVESFPLYVHNPDFLRPNVALAENEGSYLVMSWGRWALEPVGVRLPAGTGKAALGRLAGRLHETREDLPEDFGPDHLRLASQLWELERQIAAERYQAAMKILRAILNNSLVDNDG